MPFRDVLARADDPTRCCLLFHVRTVTIAVGSLQFILLSIGVCVFAMGTLYGEEQSFAPHWFTASFNGNNNEPTNAELMAKQSERISSAAQRATARNDSTFVDGQPPGSPSTGIQSKRNTATAGGCPQNETSCVSNSTRIRGNPLALSDELSGRLVTICVLSLGVLVTLMLIYGALRRRAALLIPYLCVQLVDLCTTLVNWTAALSGNERRRWLSDHSLCLPDSIVRSRLDTLSDSSALFLVLLFGFATIMLKLCWLQCVWNCYKFVVRYRVNEAALQFGASGFDEVLAGANGAHRRLPFSVGRISAWRSRMAAEAGYDNAPSARNPLQTAAGAESDNDQEMAGLMPPKYEDVVPAEGDTDRPPTPNYAPPPYCEPCSSNSLIDTEPIPISSDNDAAAAHLLVSQISCEGGLTMLRAGGSGQLLLTDATGEGDNTGEDATFASAQPGSQNQSLTHA